MSVGWGRSLVPILSILLLYSPALAEEYLWHENPTLRLGKGFDPRKPHEDIFTRCVTGTPKDVDFNPSAVPTPAELAASSATSKAFFRGKMITSEEDYYAQLGISTKLDVHYAFFSGSASLAQKQSVRIHRDSLTWIVKAEVEFGLKQLEDVEPIAKFESLEVETFINRYGTEVVVGEVRGARAAFVLTAINVSDNVRNEVAASISTALSGVGSGGSFDASYSKAVEKLQQSSYVTIDAYTEGGRGNEVLLSFAASAYNLASMRNALTKYFESVTPQTAVPFRFTTGLFSQIYNLKGETFNIQGDRIKILYKSYRDFSRLEDRLSEYLSPLPYSKSKVFLLPLSIRRDMELKRNIIAKKVVSIAKAGRKCLMKKDCNVPITGDVEDFNYPQVPVVPKVVILRLCFTPVDVGRPLAQSSGSFAVVGEIKTAPTVTIEYNGVSREVLLYGERRPDSELKDPGSGGTICKPDTSVDASKAILYGDWGQEVEAGAGLPLLKVTDGFGRWSFTQIRDTL